MLAGVQQGWGRGSPTTGHPKGGGLSGYSDTEGGQGSFP